MNHCRNIRNIKTSFLHEKNVLQASNKQIPPLPMSLRVCFGKNPRTNDMAYHYQAGFGLKNAPLAAMSVQTRTASSKEE